MPVIEISSQEGRDFSGDVLIVPVFSGRERHRLPLNVSKVARQVMEEGDFRADYLELVPLHHPNGVKDCRWMLLIGLGSEEGVTTNKIRRAVGTAVRHALKKKWRSVGLIVPTTSALDHDVVQTVVLEGALLADYDVARFKGKPEPRRLERIELFTHGEDTRKLRRRQPVIEAGVQACHLVRDLVNTPAAELHPSAFAELARQMAKEGKFQAEILDREALAKGQFHCILAVGQGSAHEPRAVRLDYKPKEKAKRHIVLVGKGLCFDSGGLDLKDASGMETMKCDMAGAAIVLATIAACAKVQAPVHITGLLGLVENMPSGSAYKPGDVLKSRSGKTIEILNTDAEGRLVLADLLHWASEMKPDHIVDLATLTGACSVALGDGVSGILGADQRLVDRLMDAGQAAGEYLWQLPLVEEYRRLLESQFADLKNIAGSKYGGAISAGLFLKEFVDHASWAHVDLSSVWSSSEKDYRTYGGTGEGPRWLLEWLAD